MSHPYKFLALSRALVRPEFRNSPSFRCLTRSLTMGSLDAVRSAIAEQVKFDILTKTQDAVCSLSTYLWC